MYRSKQNIVHQALFLQQQQKQRNLYRKKQKHERFVLYQAKTF